MKFRALTALACVSVVTLTIAAAAKPSSSFANGRAIFQTGRALAGVAIRAKPPPMHPACAACHRATGSGGLHPPRGVVSPAPRLPPPVPPHRKKPTTTG